MHWSSSKNYLKVGLHVLTEPKDLDKLPGGISVQSFAEGPDDERARLEDDGYEGADDEDGTQPNMHQRKPLEVAFNAHGIDTQT